MSDIEMQQECSVCGEETDISDGIILPCSDFFCARCLNRWFRTACESEGSFPPQCCGQRTPLGGRAEILLNPDTLTLYKEKRLEFETEAAKRVYCHKCSAFIYKSIFDLQSHQIFCGKCRAFTCLSCKAKSHSGRCQLNLADQQVIDLAYAQGWRQCHCGYLVDRSAGCNHMTCKCGRQFCFLCGKQWRTCNCPYSGPARNDAPHQRMEVLGQPVPTQSRGPSSSPIQRPKLLRSINSLFPFSHELLHEP
ncbi:hypothetical protein N431DRAFT_174352 [Stipitochalara longipes BDJ]|nr:hypothetical protein N431DRAFT_174352 [Stipitochalara longipes BDJ]